MDISTQTTRDLYRAVSILIENFCAGRIDYLPPSPTPLRTKVAGGGYPLHSHPFVEIVQAFDGPARLNLSGARVELKGRRVTMVLPGTVHCEGFICRRRRYKLLWAVVTPSGVNLFVSSYRPDRGFGVQPDRFLGLADDPRELWDLTRRADLAEDFLARARLQGCLIRLLAEALVRMDKTTSVPDDPRRALVGQVREYLDLHFREHVTLDDLARMVRCTPNYLNGLFQQMIGSPIHRYILDRRLELAEKLLGRGKPVKEAAFEAGFKDPLYFSRVFRRRRGLAPSRYGSTSS